MATKLLLIRHGETSWNLRKRYCGFADIALSRKGKKQARKLRDKINSEKIDKIYSSDRERVVSSARIIFGNRRVEQVRQLREINFGIFEGLTYGRIMKKYAPLYKQWLSNPFCVTIPKGEHLRDFKRRVVKAFNGIISQNKNKTVAVVCHGGTISIYLNHLLKTKRFWDYIPRAASLSAIEFIGGKPKVCLLNDTSHL